MNLFVEAFAWLADPQHWVGPGGVARRTLEHLAITLSAVSLAAVVAVPVGVLIGHRHTGQGVVGALSGAARAVPTLGLLTLAGLALGIGLAGPMVALVVLAVPSLLAGAYAGVDAVDRETTAAARAVGMTPGQVVRRVELPLAAPVIIGGFRSAVLQVVATATLAAYVADAGLGRFLFIGLKSRDYPQMLAGALVVAALALVLELALAAAQRFARARWVPGRSATVSTSRRRRRRGLDPSPRSATTQEIP